MTKSKFFRVAVEGATVDGRVIDRKWLEEMAETYNPATYAARVNLEHIRGAMPLGPNTPFGSYGDVLALKTDTVELDLGGQKVQKLGLFAQVKPLPPLLDLIAKGQKLYTSMEVNPAFAGTGKAYFMGLAATDNPASLGTEILEFSAKLGDKSPLAARKQQPGNFFSVATETLIEMEEEQPSADPTGVFASLKNLIDSFKPQAPQPKVETPPPAQEQQQPNGSDFAAFGAAIGQMAGAIDKLATSTSQQFTALRGEIDTLKGTIETTPAHGQHARPLSTGVTEPFSMEGAV